eukprot:scaffold59311_cov39-Phaeocystis_antarctica.AAC.1
MLTRVSQLRSACAAAAGEPAYRKPAIAPCRLVLAPLITGAEEDVQQPGRGRGVAVEVDRARERGEEVAKFARCSSSRPVH